MEYKESLPKCVVSAVFGVALHVLPFVRHLVEEFLNVWMHVIVPASVIRPLNAIGNDVTEKIGRNRRQSRQRAAGPNTVGCAPTIHSREHSENKAWIPAKRCGSKGALQKLTTMQTKEVI